MKIKSQILQPYLEQLRYEFEELGRELHPKADDKQVGPLVELTREKIQQIENLTSWLHEAPQQVEGPSAEGDAFESFRKLKIDLRTARRKWLRVLSNESRFRKLRSKKGHVATFAA